MKSVLNGNIKEKKVRIVGSPNIDDKQEMPLNKALEVAKSQHMDLVQVGLNNGIAICKIMDYKKFEYSQKKHARQNQKPKQTCKEVRMNDGIADNDIKIKANTVNRILSEGDKVKVVILYKGRLIKFIHRGLDKLEEFKALINDPYVVDSNPRIEGNRVYMVVSPKKS